MHKRWYDIDDNISEFPKTVEEFVNIKRDLIEINVVEKFNKSDVLEFYRKVKKLSDNGALDIDRQSCAQYLVDNYPTEEKFTQHWVKQEIESYHNSARNRWNKRNKYHRERA